MTKLTQERASQTIEANRKILYHIPSGYPAIRYYLESGYLRDTLFAIYRFLRKQYTKQDGDNHIIIDRHRYEFFVDNRRLSFGIRNSSGTGTSNRHINFLCAMGIFRKIPQTEETAIQVNKNWKAGHPDKRYINVFSFREMTQQELDRIEKRSERLKHAGITAGNMSFNQLWLAITDLQDIATEVYPDRRTRQNYAETPLYRQFQLLRQCINVLIDSYGYATKELINDNLTLPKPQIDKLFRIFREHLKREYQYKRPNKKEQERFNLQKQQYIFIRKEQHESRNEKK